jgi:hypothetical protein
MEPHPTPFNPPPKNTSQTFSLPKVQLLQLAINIDITKANDISEKC